MKARPAYTEPAHSTVGKETPETGSGQSRSSFISTGVYRGREAHCAHVVSGAPWHWEAHALRPHPS